MNNGIKDVDQLSHNISSCTQWHETFSQMHILAHLAFTTIYYVLLSHYICLPLHLNYYILKSSISTSWQ